MVKVCKTIVKDSKLLKNIIKHSKPTVKHNTI